MATTTENRPVRTQNVFPVQKIVMHHRPHLDELAALLVLRNELSARTKYPGVEDADVIFFDESVHFDGRREIEWLMDGYLFVGVRGGYLDDHPHSRFPKACTLTLTLKAIGLGGDRRYRMMNREVLKEDREGAGSLLHIATLIKRAYDVADWEAVYAATELLLLGFLRSQELYFATIDEVQKAEPIDVPNEQFGDLPLRLVVLESDSSEAARLARSRDGWEADLVVVRRSNGHHYICTNERRGMESLTDLVTEIRFAEQRAAGEVRIYDRSRLGRDGTLPEIPQWHFQENASQIFNGSLTATTVSPSKVALSEICEICKNFLANCSPKKK